MKRNKNLDLTKSIAIILVIIIHVSGKFISRNDPNSYNFLVANLFETISRVSVPLFIMASGALNLKTNRQETKIEYYKKRLKTVLIPTLFFSMFYIAFSYLFLFLENEANGFNLIITPIYNTFQGRPYYHLWYIYMYLGLIFATPFLNDMIKNINNRELKIISISLIILGFLLNLTSKLYWLILFVQYIGYYLIGYIIVDNIKNKKRFNKSFVFMIYIVSSILIFILNYLMFKYNFEIILNNLYFTKDYFYTYLSPFVIMSSISLFYIINSLKEINFSLANLSKNSFYIYFYHAAILKIIEFILVNIKGEEIYNWINPWSYILVVTVLVLFISYWMSLLTHYILRINKERMNKNDI